MLAEGSVWRTEPTGEAIVRWVYDFDDPVAAAPRHALEFGFVLLLLIARRVTQADVRYRAVRFRHAQPRGAAAHTACFGCEVVYGQVRDEIEFDASLLSVPIQTSNPALLEHLAAHGRELVRALPTGAQLVDRVRHALHTLPVGVSPLGHTARALHCSERTVQRWLGEAGTSMHTLLDEVRYLRAREMLRDRSVPVKEIAASLGFSEPAAFHRAFVRWSGRPPGRWRAEFERR